MTHVVVDASAIVSVILPDEAGPFAELVLACVEASVVAVPPHWPLEVANAVVVASRRNRLINVDTHKVRSRAAAFINAATAFPGPATDSLIQLAMDTGLTAYDAAYIDLARRLDCALLTNDRQMKVAASALAIRVFE